MELQQLISTTSLGTLIRLSINIGLMLFTAAFYIYLLAKARKWVHFSALLISITGIAFPVINIYRLLITVGAAVPYSRSLLINLEHYFISAIILLFSLFIFLRYNGIDDGNGVRNGLSEARPGLRLNAGDNLMLTVAVVGGFLLIVLNIVFPEALIKTSATGEGVPGPLMYARDILFLTILTYSLLRIVVIGFSRKQILNGITVSAVLSVFIIFHLLDMKDMMGGRFFGAGLSALLVTISFVLVREYLDQANRTRNVEHELAYLESHDPMTGLENRRRFYNSLNRLCSDYNVDEHSSSTPLHAAVIYIDLDYFNDINDSLGNDGGNEILRSVAERFSLVVDERGRLFRTGGDEFAVVLSRVSTELDLALLSEKLLQALSEPFTWDWHTVFLTASAGISVFPKDGASMEDLTSHADQALQEAKLDRNTYRFYTPAMQERAVSRIQMINYLRQAVDRRELSLHFQPQLNIDGTLVGAEALLRWNHGILGSVSPKEFIPIAEETGLILPIGTWVIEEACRTLADWRERDIEIPISINLSPRQLRDVKLQRTLISNLRENNLHPGLLHLEITENSLIENQENLINKLQNLSDIGLNFSIDDFGTGYSSLSYLKDLPIAAVKIDRSFVIDLPFDSQNSALVQAIIAMVQGLGYRVVAEGVDSEEQLNFLKANKCDIIQGYYHSKPLNGQGFLDYVRELKNA